MKKATTWSLLVVFGALPVLTIGINQAANDSSPGASTATGLATRLFNSFSAFSGTIFLIVGVAIIASWVYGSDGNGGGF